jgi:sorting nexin-13
MYVLNFAEELQHLIGSETTRQGVMLVFNMFQNPRLNRRLAYVIFEGILETIFADNSFPETFRKLHSESPRVRVDRTNSDSVAGDLRSSNSFARKR